MEEETKRLIWYDNCAVSVASNYYCVNEWKVEINKSVDQPFLLKMYNKGMGGFDVAIDCFLLRNQGFVQKIVVVFISQCWKFIVYSLTWSLLLCLYIKQKLIEMRVNIFSLIMFLSPLPCQRSRFNNSENNIQKNWKFMIWDCYFLSDV